MRNTGICVLALSSCALASQKVFSVNDDVLAYPQFEIEFSDKYILDTEARAKLHDSKSRHSTKKSSETEDGVERHNADYERMIYRGHEYLCSIPQVHSNSNTTEEKISKEDQQKELIRAADRGWQLLQDMEGKQCLYYSTGWWSYSFCYNSHVKQFHSLPPSPGSARMWPPQEDQTTPSYILGKYEANSASGSSHSSSSSANQEAAELQTRADGNYLVQRLEGGTPCDLTGKARKVEVEFHCHPQATDRIGWIKETATCAYLMVIYTPRLCNDAAFLPSRDSQAHTISCQRMLTISDAAHLEGSSYESADVEKSEEAPIMIGNIELGAMKHVGKDGKKLERGRIVMTAEEKAETIIMQKDGQIQGLSRTKMEELNLVPEDIEYVQQELQKTAGSRDWKIERLGDGQGQTRLRILISAEGEGADEQYEVQRVDEDEEGSEEEYRHEL